MVRSQGSLWYDEGENDKNNSQESNFFRVENISPLSLDDQKLCEEEVECINAINGFKKDETPSTDGFSAEFIILQIFLARASSRNVIKVSFCLSNRITLDQSMPKSYFSHSQKRQRQIMIRKFATNSFIECRL